MAPFDDPSALTAEMVQDPRAGDRLTEMYAAFVYVLFAGANLVVWVSANPPCRLPDDATIHVGTPKDWRAWCSYGSSFGHYWLRGLDRDNDVDGWLAVAMATLVQEIGGNHARLG